MPLPPIDTDQVACFWKRFLAAGVVEPSTPVPQTVEPFGDSVELADELIGLVVHGPKRATAGALVDYELEGASPPKPGLISIATALGLPSSPRMVVAVRVRRAHYLERAREVVLLDDNDST